jgi:hypothetical protein
MTTAGPYFDYDCIYGVDLGVRILVCITEQLSTREEKETLATNRGWYLPAPLMLGISINQAYFVSCLSF